MTCTFEYWEGLFVGYLIGLGAAVVAIGLMSFARKDNE